MTTRRRRGFSLLEMLIVVAILGLIATLVFTRLGGAFGKSKVKVTQTALASATTSVEQFHVDVGRYPTEEEGLEVLLTEPEQDAEKWDGPYLEKDYIPKDGWDRAFEYDPGESGRYVIRSLGADGRPGGEGEDKDIDNRSS